MCNILYAAAYTHVHTPTRMLSNLRAHGRPLRDAVVRMNGVQLSPLVMYLSQRLFGPGGIHIERSASGWQTLPGEVRTARLRNGPRLQVHRAIVLANDSATVTFC